MIRVRVMVRAALSASNPGAEPARARRRNDSDDRYGAQGDGRERRDLVASFQRLVASVAIVLLKVVMNEVDRAPSAIDRAAGWECETRS